MQCPDEFSFLPRLSLCPQRHDNETPFPFAKTHIQRAKQTIELVQAGVPAMSKNAGKL